MSGIFSHLSLVSATNENYAALANVKFDFSLIKMEAPIEFNGIASALSNRRRIEAEEGPSHKTARRLGALFEDLVPSTPKLISAFGLRMSEIINTSGVNAIGTGQHGPFEPYVGADELVAARKNEIKQGLQNNNNISTTSVVGACQDITRNDLALWDSSARAWLRRADKAKQWSQCQLSLVVHNIKTPIPGGPSTYNQVMNVWKQSMLAVEQFLSGKPQDIVDGSVFLAFSAWHLYPDLFVLGDKPTKINFKDNLVPSSAVGTVGMEGRFPEKDGARWSLALSHLQYYGAPVVVRSDQEGSRMTFSQLQIVALGGLLGRWRVSPRDYSLVAEWFKLLWFRMVDLNPEDFNHTFALCSEDTIYVPAVVLSDPYVPVPDYEMRSITGNIGRQGISLLVPPVEPRVRELGNSYSLVPHETYDFRRENNFRETSLHLSFTDWTFPLATEISRMIDHDAHVVEAVISVHHRGLWIGDIDILEVDFRNMLRFEPMKPCEENHAPDCDFDYTSIDSWEELLDEPGNVGVFRAHGNWAARLAAVSILSRSEAGGQNFGVLGPEPFCLRCLEEELEKPGWNMHDYESKLPSFCID
ncbi:unnamed protein product [Alternaria alternata]